MFNFRNFNYKFVIVIIVLVLFIFLGGKYLFQQYRVNQPLENQLLEYDKVKNVELIDNNNKTDVKIELKKSVNIYNAYQEIENISQNHLEDDFGKIILLDDRNSRLEEIYYELHYTLFEGIVTSRYTRMKTQFDEIIEKKGIEDYELRVDNENIYLKLVDNDNYLLKVISGNNSEKSGGETDG
ncbi:MAG: hypothetical protein ACOC1O_02235 [bacterium]